MTNSLTEAVKILNTEISLLSIAYLEATSGEAEHKALREVEWHLNLQRKFELHPAVEALAEKHPPADAMLLVWQWPHVSETDGKRLAYTRDKEHGKADRQTVTSIGKYLKRHWPDLPDHVIRDAIASFTPDEFEIQEGIKALITAVELGPRSCMQSGYGSIPFDEEQHQRLVKWLADPEGEEPDWHLHPYSVYIPDYGWKIAVRKNAKGEIQGRCLLLETGLQKCFVRSYARPSNPGDYSQTDHMLEAWLKNQCFASFKAWPQGAKLDVVFHPEDEGYLLPYIDGHNDSARRVTLCSPGHFKIDSIGEYLCENTDGTATVEEENMVECYDCEDLVSKDDIVSVYGGDRWVCQCCSERYVWATLTTRNREVEMQIHEDEAVPVYKSFRAYDFGNAYAYTSSENPSEGFYWIANRECFATEAFVAPDPNGDYVFIDDPEVVKLAKREDGAEYCLKGEAWKDGTGDWYHESVDSVTVDGELYLERDCKQCDLTGIWYLRNNTTFYEMENEDSIAEENVQRVSSDAEWGDCVMEEITSYNIKDAIEREGN